MISLLARAVAIAVVFSALVAHAASQRILFVGNSYTGVNNLPEMFRELAASNGLSPEIKASTPGGVTLKQHLEFPATLKLIDEGDWDFVVLQGQSQESALAEISVHMRTNFLQGAAGLYERIKTNSPQAKVLLYETWARHADYWKDPKSDTSVGDSPAQMQARIRRWYQAAAAQRKDFMIAPVGDAWELNYQSPAPLRLHGDDNSHPQVQGSYLAALVIYATLYQPPKLAVTYRGDLPEAEARQLQQLAQHDLKR
jgi:hypothetical protein